MEQSERDKVDSVVERERRKVVDETSPDGFAVWSAVMCYLY